MKIYVCLQLPLLLKHCKKLLLNECFKLQNWDINGKMDTGLSCEHGLRIAQSQNPGITKTIVEVKNWHSILADHLVIKRFGLMTETYAFFNDSVVLLTGYHPMTKAAKIRMDKLL